MRAVEDEIEPGNHVSARIIEAEAGRPRVWILIETHRRPSIIEDGEIVDVVKAEAREREDILCQRRHGRRAHGVVAGFAKCSIAFPATCVAVVLCRHGLLELWSFGIHIASVYWSFHIDHMI